jgi:hypothetical protein
MATRIEQAQIARAQIARARIVRGPIGSKTWTLILTIGCLVSAGCGGKTDRLGQAYQDAGLAKTPVAQFSGVVTVDGTAPATFTLVMLWNPKQPNAGMLRTICDSEGRFTFTSYEPGDGVPPGNYVVLFARFNMGRPLGNFDGPDLLNNLYNDPDKNASKPEFQITVDAPGKSDYRFNLAVAGEQPATPGPHSVTEVKTVM